MKKCPKCGYIQHAKPSHRPKKYTLDQERQIVEDAKTMILKKVAEKWGCHEQTVRNIIKRNEYYCYLL